MPVFLYKEIVLRYQQRGHGKGGQKPPFRDAYLPFAHLALSPANMLMGYIPSLVSTCDNSVVTLISRHQVHRRMRVRFIERDHKSVHEHKQYH